MTRQATTWPRPLQRSQYFSSSIPSSTVKAMPTHLEVSRRQGQDSTYNSILVILNAIIALLLFSAKTGVPSRYMCFSIKCPGAMPQWLHKDPSLSAWSSSPAGPEICPPSVRNRLALGLSPTTAAAAASASTSDPVAAYCGSNWA